MDQLSCALLPCSCRLCGLPLARLTRAPICASCWNSLTPQTGTLCSCCGENLGVASFSANSDAAGPPGQVTDRLCRPCRLAPPAFRRAVAYGRYETTLRGQIHCLKYDGMHPVAEGLGRRLARSIEQIQDLPDELLLVSVPLHRAKQRQRGFNHAELLARAARRELLRLQPRRRLTLAPALLERRRPTESQAGLTPHQRRENLRAAFAVPQPEQVKDRAVLLIDDIYTSGATARACSRVLIAAGAAAVWVATVARAQREQTAARPAIAPEPAELPMHEDVAFWGAEAERRHAHTVP